MRATSSRRGEGAGRVLSRSQMAGFCLYAGCAVARSVAGFGGGGGAFAGLASLPDATHDPSILTGLPGAVGGAGGTAGAVVASGASGPGSSLLCAPRQPRREFEPDLEDELLWRRLLKKVGRDAVWGDWARDRVALDEGPAAGGGQQAEAGDPDESDAHPDHGESERDHDPGRGPAPDRETDSDVDPDRDVFEEPHPEELGPETDAAALRSEPRSALTLIRRRPCGLIALIGLAVSLVALGFEFFYLRRLANPTGADIVRNAAYGAFTLTWMMLLSIGVRTLRIRDVVRFWLLGFFGAVALVAVGGKAITAVVEPGLLRTAILVPILEEVVKGLLLVAFLVVAVRGRRREPSITDMVIIGFALGAAFGVHEDGLWVRVSADGFGSGWWGTLFPAYVWERFVVIGHAGFTGLVGLGIGFAWHLRRHPLAWLAAAVPLALAIVDHMSINWVFVEPGVDTAGFRIREMLGHGAWPARILLGGFVLAIVVDGLAMRRETQARPLPEWSTFSGMQARLRSLPGMGAKAVGGVLLLAERRARLGARYAEHRGPRLEITPEAAAGTGQ